MTLAIVDEQEIDRTYLVLKKEAEGGGYFLNPDVEFTKNLVRGLLKNEQRYGYRACPCRLASGKKDEDLVAGLIPLLHQCRQHHWLWR